MKQHRHFSLDFSLVALFSILRITATSRTNSSQEPCPDCGTQWRSTLFENTLKRAVRRISSDFVLTAVILVPCWAPVLAHINSKRSKAEGEVAARATLLSRLRKNSIRSGRSTTKLSCFHSTT